MSYFPPEMPRPEPTADEAGFWAHCSARSLRFQTCAACGTHRHPPIPMCFKCHSCEVAWVEAPLEAEVYTFTVIHHAGHPAVRTRLPYVVAVVAFPGLAGVRLITNLTHADLARVRIGMRCILWWDDIGDGMFVPRFRAIDDAAATQHDKGTS